MFCFIFQSSFLDVFSNLKAKKQTNKQKRKKKWEKKNNKNRKMESCWAFILWKCEIKILATHAKTTWKTLILWQFRKEGNFVGK